MSRTKIVLTVAAAALALSMGVALAQQGGGGGRGGRGGRGGFDPAQMRQRMMQRYQEMLGASDEDWTALEPLVTKVMDLQRDARGGGGMGFMFGGRGGRRGGGGFGGAQPQGEQSAVEKAAADLQATLENENASAETIKTQLTAYRKAREDARQQLAKAQEELRAVLTVRQEAQLVLIGMLD